MRRLISTIAAAAAALLLTTSRPAQANAKEPKAQQEASPEWGTPSTIRSKSSAISLPPPKYPARLKWVAEIIPTDSNKLQAIISSEDGSSIDIVYHYDRKKKTRIPSNEIIEWGIGSNGSITPAAAYMVPALALITGIAGQVQQFTIYITFIDANGKPYSILFDPYDNGKILASLLRDATGLEPSERRSSFDIEKIRSSRVHIETNKARSPLEHSNHEPR
jgi:hypothetical protein